jgi:transcription antitermination protein NusB
MGERRIARELALQALYKLDMLGESAAGALGGFWEHFVPESIARGGDSERFARELVAGVDAHRARIDELIGAAAEHWQLPRLSRVDLNVLRLATFELLGRPEIPAAVTIDEAIEVARRYGSEDSPRFVNGVLDHIAGVLGVRGREGRPE